MPEDEQGPPAGAEKRAGKEPRPWFRRNRSGPGWHPSSWQGGLILGIVVAAIIVVVVLFRTGVL